MPVGRAPTRRSRRAGPKKSAQADKAARAIPAKDCVRAWARLVREVARRRRSDRAAVRALADAVFAQRDPIGVAIQLLDSDKHTVAARVWERLLEYRFGKPKQMMETTGAGGGPIRVEIISHIPRPPHGYVGQSEQASVPAGKPAVPVDDNSNS